jgi:hypothetical protein
MMHNRADRHSRGKYAQNIKWYFSCLSVPMFTHRAESRHHDGSNASF